MSKNKSSLKSRGTIFYIVFYGQQDELDYALSKSLEWTYIFHSLDDEDPHFHCILKYQYQRTVTAVIKDFISRSNVFVECCASIPGSFEYFTHANDPDKYQYNSDRVVYSHKLYWDNLLTSSQRNKKEDELYEFVSDLEVYARGAISSRAMAVKYGRDFIKNHYQYKEFGYLLLKEEPLAGKYKI